MKCKETGCEAEALDQATYCGLHINGKRRCKATKAGSNGTLRCKKPALLGLDVCERHGGSFPNAKAASERAQTLTAMQRFVRPYEGDLNPVTAFEMEFRRTLGRIAWYDEQLAALKSEKDLIWGVTKKERIGAGEFTGTNKTYEARVNVLEEMQRWERRHLLDMEKVWISAGLESAKLDLMRTYVDQTYELTMAALKALGIDPLDPEVRATMAEVFNAQATPLLEIEGPR